MIGRAKAEQAWRRSRLSIGNLSARIKELGIDRGVDRPAVGSTSPAMRSAGRASGRGGGEAARRASARPAHLTAGHLRRKLRHRARRSNLSATGNLTLDPRKLTAGLLLKALERGARFCAPAEATAIEDGRNEVVIYDKRPGRRSPPAMSCWQPATS